MHGLLALLSFLGVRGVIQRDRIVIYHKKSYIGSMALLSVNVNKVATLRNARGKDRPNVLSEALTIVGYGAHGITVHPRPDERHIRWSDVQELKANIPVELNIEGYPSEDFLERVFAIQPAQCTLVPDPPDVLTSNAGWSVEKSQDLLMKVIPQFKDSGIRLSLFIDPSAVEVTELLFLRDQGAHRIELYTEAYAEAHPHHHKEAIKPYQRVAQIAHSMGLGINAGHDLNSENLGYFARHIPELSEVSIGHALVCDALHWGWEKTIRTYLKALS